MLRPNPGSYLDLLNAHCNMVQRRIDPGNRSVSPVEPGPLGLFALWTFSAFAPCFGASASHRSGEKKERLCCVIFQSHSVVRSPVAPGTGLLCHRPDPAEPEGGFAFQP